MKIVFYTAIIFLFVSVSCSENAASDEAKNKKAALTLDELLVEHPDSVPLLFQKGELLCDSMNWDAARPFVIKAFRLDSNNIAVRLLYAEVLVNGVQRPISDWVKAQYHYHKVVQNEPENTRALVGLASTYTQLGDYENSFKYINDALKVDKYYRDAYILKARNYAEQNKPELVKSSLQTAIEQDPEYMLAYFMLGTVYEKEKNIKCLEYYKSAYQLAPNDAGVEYQLAYSLHNFNQVDEAMEIYRKMATRKDKYYSSQAMFQLGYIKEFSNDLDSAAYFYTQAKDIAPLYKEAWLNLGIVYYKLGNKSLALKNVSEALQLDPEYELAQDAAEKIKKGK